MISQSGVKNFNFLNFPKRVKWWRNHWKSHLLGSGRSKNKTKLQQQSNPQQKVRIIYKHHQVNLSSLVQMISRLGVKNLSSRNFLSKVNSLRRQRKNLQLNLRIGWKNTITNNKNQQRASKKYSKLKQYQPKILTICLLVEVKRINLISNLLEVVIKVLLMSSQ